ncbi:MAG: hypothetical protein EPO67_14765 [Reyranella sp.]|jgi:hypothetical protein|nr:MAG: hypothetical protein EPO67_14765 [Reyranella sp.]
MRNLSWLAAAGLAMVTAGCVEQSGYPQTYGYGAPAYGYSNGYSGYSNNYVSQPAYSYSQPTYYRAAAPTYYSAPVYTAPQTRYVPVQAAPPRSSYRGMRDSDGDGIPNRYDKDKNGDGVPDKYQRRRSWSGG